MAAESPEALVARVEDYAAEWRERQCSTDPADRHRAEAAIRGLYAEARRPAPEIVWVPSPAAGAHAYHLGHRGRRQVLGSHTRGDRGTGENKRWHALAQPFDLPPSWLRSLRGRIRSQLPPERANRALEGDLFEGASRVMALLAASLEDDAGPGRAVPLKPPVPLTRREIDRIGRASMRGEWERYESRLGRRLMHDLVREAISVTIGDLLDPAISMPDAMQAIQPGQFDAVAPTYGLVLDVLRPPAWRSAEREARTALLRRRMEIAASSGPWWALDGLVIVSERPLVLRTDPRGRPHCEDGPAIAYPDGMTVWAWHGVLVPDWVVTHPERIDVAALARQRNVEVRRVMAERLGWERIATEGGAMLVHQDAAGRLWETNEPIEGTGSWGRNAKFVEVENSTPEPDGSRKHYFIRVPPEMRSAQQAVAWTFELGEVQYSPAVET